MCKVYLKQGLTGLVFAPVPVPAPAPAPAPAPLDEAEQCSKGIYQSEEEDLDVGIDDEQELPGIKGAESGRKVLAGKKLGSGKRQGHASNPFLRGESEVTAERPSVAKKQKVVTQQAKAKRAHPADGSKSKGTSISSKLVKAR